MQATAPDQPSRSQVLQPPRRAHRYQDPSVVLRNRDHLVVAANIADQVPDEPLDQLFEVALPQAEVGRKRGVEVVQRNVDHRLAVDHDDRPAHLKTVRHGGAGEPMLIEDLQRAAVDVVGAAEPVGRAPTLEQHESDAPGPQLGGEHQTRRTSADDRHVDFRHFGTVPAKSGHGPILIHCLVPRYPHWHGWTSGGRLA